MIFFKSRRIKALELTLEKLILTTESINKKVDSKLSGAVDQKFEFQEILECIDDIMKKLEM